MKTYLSVLALCMLGLVSGCMGIQARFSFNNEADFNALKTYAWRSDARESFTDPADAEHYVNAMNAQLASKGFKQVQDSPDFFIHTFPSEKYTDVYLTTHGEVEFFRGRISLQFLDAKTGVMIWEGVAKAYLSEETNPTEVKKAINKGVETLMKGFPPTMGK